MPRKILVTSALPYANGPLHLGHLIEAVQTDIWVRYQKMRGHDCLYVCAEDAHGTPIMIKAKAEGITPEALITRTAAEHLADYQGFLIGHDHFHSTHTPETQYFTDLLYARLRDAGYMTRRSVRQAYDEQAAMFLPDRFVRGTCPRCKAPDQYGDSCEACGATYVPADLIDPVSTVSGTRPVWRDSEHIFFALGRFEPMLREWLASGSLQPAVQAKLAEWFEAGLQDWDISRDAPYFGFEVPDSPGKYFYVWFDAPIGYLGSFKALAERRGLDIDAYLRADSSAEMYHFIGKDISYFHTLFWPAVLHGAGLRRPTAVFVHGFLTVDGQKMSKSRGSFITARHYLERLPPEPLRYYFAAKLGPGIDDIDLALEDFTARINSDIVGKLVNIASRCAGFIERGGGQLATDLPDPALYAEFSAAAERIGAAFEGRDYSTAIRDIMQLADKANQYVDQHKPWALAKDPAKADEVRAIATQGINLFRVLMTYLAPVLPAMADAAGRFLGTPLERWEDVQNPLLGSALARYEPLATRLDPKIVATLIAAPADAAPAAKAAAATTARRAAGGNVTAAAASAGGAAKAGAGAPAATPAAAAASIGIDDFARLDLRVAQVVAATAVEGSDKLLRLTLDLGGEQRNVFSGIRSAYRPEDLVGRHVVMIANLAPRKMRFGISEGMVLCASGKDDTGGLFLLSADAGVRPGMKVS
ncbi:MAG: methionine--tRNA ligase [Steroidobacteraceae bacterium]|nr:methionine--tRNA ligase [Nevskiaceae bacterium]MCP5339016.1 methionine--tRNA ligase [Nevskiaceae bacterium]MCP5359572.1 methionine--tRNA ligase [Nevskiaceae bacterium]MCP5473028.1 methionine--tRNA ligase [Nevskiaceae bacterium]